MLSNLTGMHFFVILFVVLLLFGAPKLPGLARSLGQSLKILKTEVGHNDADKPAETPAGTTTGTGSTGSSTGAAGATTAPAASAAGTKTGGTAV